MSSVKLVARLSKLVFYDIAELCEIIQTFAEYFEYVGIFYTPKLLEALKTRFLLMTYRKSVSADSCMAPMDAG